MSLQDTAPELALEPAPGSVRHFALHLGEMVLAMIAAVNMTAGMTVWMRHRRHDWARVAEMAGAMFVPAVVAIVLFWLGVLAGGSVLAVEHAAMLPAMVAVMLLHREEYSRDRR